MSKPSKSRYDLFNLIHKGLRAMLYSTGLSVQHNDFRNREETYKLFEDISEVLVILSDHTLNENKFILPLVAKNNEAVIKGLEKEHQDASSFAHRLTNLMALYNYIISEEEVRESGETFYKTFNNFIAFCLDHMNREEETLNQLLWRNFSDEQLLWLYKAITSSIPPEKVALYGRWVMRGINNREIIDWLLSYHGSFPQAFKFLLELAEEELPEARWNSIKDALCEGEMLPC